MKFSNANSFKAKIKNIAREKGIPAQQVQQNYLIEKVLKLISESQYKDSFIVKGGFLIGQMIGLDKRTTMDLDVTLKGQPLSEENIQTIFKEIVSRSSEDFQFEIDILEPIRQDDEYGGFSLKLNATFDTLREVVFIDITTGDRITPREITYQMQSVFSENKLEVWTYNLETVLAEKLETIIRRGAASTRPRDRYDLYILYHLRKDEIDISILKTALNNTAKKRESLDVLTNWESQLEAIRSSDYQNQLWSRYQKSFRYASEISFEESVEVVAIILNHLGG
ncbi:TPA: nucleotidyl transferase AbiEii/AbiGii toxin family protein [Streptococcus equi subsp. zooepidemicus]|uniref:nucleotidyl transferase AbiEii/AbiGii toxin family protein n=1 Tax=Streptococcus equi TaxID=1336 RepID=UPI001E5B9FCD|nr:nucleotidyl transferase AbiEii/AbiGii toxin family protein [Streptococcus equi]MCD3367208.1 nucleotidyl transferase AbiEii/AbiGii toxin family protein [Streptococcus equi subsp. zooepidemicus]MCD3447462.1 nucleotidyl transferase AbiEii/AbiGii toxin family protein [Streptococcus equi subsp. zooepidemicus]MCD3467091.1 nucleotidyl transferase AbiEii/AbiGii toxin family protein [Streptococcus equi subsp. zooepidemicus]MCD3468483.1 nucleotidyl transferase AbiEii/AbiGii toxin family protein [Strep